MKADQKMIAGYLLIAAITAGCGGGEDSPDSAGSGVNLSGRSVAVLVGISGYADVLIPDLTYSDDDAGSMANILREDGWEVILLTDAAATKDAMRTAIAQGLADSEHFLFYYSGHGTRYSGVSYICPADSEYNRGTGRLAAETLVSGSDLRTWLARNNGSAVAVVLDCCFSGGMVESRTSPQIAGKVHAGKGKYIPFCLDDNEGQYTTDAEVYLSGKVQPEWVVLQATGPDELAAEISSLGHSVFTFAILDTLTDPSSDTNEDGWVSAEEAYRAAMDRWSGNGSVQTPRMYDGDPADEYALTTA